MTSSLIDVHPTRASADAAERPPPEAAIADGAGHLGRARAPAAFQPEEADRQMQGADRVRNPKRPSDEGAPWWVAAALLAIFGAAMFLSGYIIGSG